MVPDAAAVFTVYNNKNTAPTNPLILTQNTYNDLVITSSDLYTWAAVHCAAPRAGLDAYFSSGFPIVPKGVMSHGEHWYAGHVSDGFNHIASDLFAFESATIYVWFDDGIPAYVDPISSSDGRLGYYLVITYYPAGTTTFPISITTTDRVLLGRTISSGTIAKTGIDFGDWPPGGFVGVGVIAYGYHDNTNHLFYKVMSDDIQNKINYIIVGNPAGSSVNSQTVMFKETLIVNGNGPTATMNVTIGDIVVTIEDAPYDGDDTLMRVNTQAVYSDDGIYRAVVDNSTYAPFADRTTGDPVAILSAAPMYTCLLYTSPSPRD